MALVLWKPTTMTALNTTATTIQGCTLAPGVASVHLSHGGKGTGALVWAAAMALSRELLNPAWLDTIHRLVRGPDVADCCTTKSDSNAESRAGAHSESGTPRQTSDEAPGGARQEGRGVQRKAMRSRCPAIVPAGLACADRVEAPNGDAAEIGNAAKGLAEVGARPPGRTTLRGKRVVEVGGGLGLVSIVAARLGASVVCTDGEKLVVRHAEINLQRNCGIGCGGVEGSAAPVGSAGAGAGAGDGAGAGALGSSPAGGGGRDGDGGAGAGAFTARVLRWGDVDGARDIVKSHGRPDLVLMADCVFGQDIEVWTMLRATLQALCSSPETLLIIAQTQRYPEREAVFFAELQRVNGFVEHHVADAAPASAAPVQMHVLTLPVDATAARAGTVT